MPDSSSASDVPSRVVLEGVPRIGFDTHKGFAFPAALEACLQYLGEDDAYDYTYLMGASGAAFALLWEIRPWSYVGDLTDRAINSGRTDPVRRTFRAIGLDYQFLPKEQRPGNEADLRRAITDSLRDNRPVLATGVVGPPACSIIAGYDEGGEVLIGWSYFQGSPGHDPASEFEPSGYFRKRGWYGDTGQVMTIGDGTRKAPPAQVYRQALKRAVFLAQRPRALGCRSGLAAYTAWAADLLRDRDFPPDDLSVLLARLDCHFGALSVVVEGRWHAALFVRRAADSLPKMAEGLQQAAACYEAQTGLMMQVVELQGGWDPHGEQVARQLGEPAVRREMAALIEQAREKDAEAAGHVERAVGE